MDNHNIRSQLLGLLSDGLARAGLSAEEVTDDVDLLDSGIVDSFGFVNFCLQMEEHFEVPIDIGEFDNEDVTKLASLVEMIARKRSA
jgi:acyl carrier protein